MKNMEYELLGLTSKYGNRDAVLPVGSVTKVGKILGITGQNLKEIETQVISRLSELSEGENFTNVKLQKALQNAEKID